MPLMSIPSEDPYADTMNATGFEKSYKVTIVGKLPSA